MNENISSDGQNDESLNHPCVCEDAFIWPRGVGYDGENYRCPGCKGRVTWKDASNQRIIPRSEFLLNSSIESNSIDNAQFATYNHSVRPRGNGMGPLVVILSLVLVVWVLSSFSSSDPDSTRISETNPPLVQVTPPPRDNYLVDPCEDTNSQEDYQDCLEELWEADYRLDRSYDIDPPEQFIDEFPARP